MCFVHTVELSPIKKSKVYRKIDVPGDNINQVPKDKYGMLSLILWLLTFMQLQNDAYIYYMHDMKIKAKTEKTKPNSKAVFISKLSSLL